MKSYLLHREGEKINDNYEYKKFVYLVLDKNKISFNHGIQF